jgi:hypothetical protein
MTRAISLARLLPVALCAIGCATNDVSAQGGTPLPVEFNGSDIGYPSVAAALAALRSLPEVHIVVTDGWTLADDAAHDTFWRFTPPGHPAWPSVIKQMMVLRDDRIAVDLHIRCEATKAACDALLVDVQRAGAGGQSSGMAASAPR